MRVLPPWSENIGKRVVRTPKVYIADTGLLHALLDIPGAQALEAHPKIGASFEGFALQEVVRALHARPEQCHSWATHQGAELDLLVVREGRRRGFESSGPMRPPSRSPCTSRSGISASSRSTWSMPGATRIPSRPRSGRSPSRRSGRSWISAGDASGASRRGRGSRAIRAHRASPSTRPPALRRKSPASSLLPMA